MAASSSANKIYSIETILWLLIYVFAIYILIKYRKKRWEFLEVVLGSIIISFIIFSAETEINLGTAVRHRSILIIPIILLLAIRHSQKSHTNIENYER